MPGCGACRLAGLCLRAYLLHALLPLHGQPLTCLGAVIGENAVAQAVLAQLCNVDGRHPARVEREHEHVAGIFHGLPFRQRQARQRPEVHVGDFPHLGHGYRPFHRLFVARENLLERARLGRGRYSLLHGLVIDRPHHPDVVARGVGAVAPRLQPRLERLHIVTRYVAERQPRAARELVQPFPKVAVYLGRPCLAKRPLELRLPVKIAHEILFPFLQNIVHLTTSRQQLYTSYT